MQADYVIVGSGSAGSALAYRLAEAVNLPVMVVLDAFFLSHTYEPIDIPEQKPVAKLDIKTETLDDMVNKTAYAVSNDLTRPSYPGGYEILAAARPDVVILQHAPARKEYDGFPGFPIHPLNDQIRAIELISGKPVVAAASALNG